MNTLREAAQQALEALELGCPPDCKDGMIDSGGVHPWGEAALIPCPNCAAITAIRAALAEPTSGDYALGYVEGFNDACKPKAEPQEPVAFKRPKVGKDHSFRLHTVLTVDDFGGDKAAFLAYGASDPELTPLYAAPQPRKRLDVHEILDLMPEGIPAKYDAELIAFCRAIEAAVWGDGK